MLMSTLFRHVAPFLAAVSLACGDSTSPEEGDLRAARRRWETAGRLSYSFTLSRSCECTPEMAGPVRVTVQDGAVVSRVYVSGGGPVPPVLESAFPSIDGLFELIEEALRQNAYSLDVRYDATLGYPTIISVDYDRQIADDEFVHIVSDYQEPFQVERAR